ncbi:HAD-IA family hydrolase [Methylocapsa palsarum]|uniref:Phosphoglycolate phosphatase n=1 Tax=Methylocapsa palsarum TaxID=1612308 RepID=A0A1I3XVU0_9HYPH|nr:HAD-IA family hydrolase [Methylocapsa palsarum]SFK23698.1 phosphoglycolate phosphatase [Methylocapsa palsarum]
MKLVIFDVDGTLVDSQEIILEAQRRTFCAHRLEPPGREAALSIVGLSLIEAFTVLTDAKGPVESLAQTYREAWGDVRSEPQFQDPLYPGARETLAALAGRADIVLGIATGKSRRGVALLLERYGWKDWFATIQTADDHPSKPAPDMILAAMAETAADPDQTYMIGDTSFDMAMAAAAGAHPIGVSWGYHAASDLKAAGAERIVGDFEELLHMLTS